MRNLVRRFLAPETLNERHLAEIASTALAFITALELQTSGPEASTTKHRSGAISV